MASYSLNKITTKKKDGKLYPFWTLRKTEYDKTIKTARTTYVCYIGVEPVLSETTAKKLCKENGLSLEDLQNVNRLKIVTDEDHEKMMQARRDEQAKARKQAREAKAKTTA